MTPANITAVSVVPLARSSKDRDSSSIAKTIPASGVLTNDTDADSNPLTAILVSNPTHGILVLSTNGGFTYTPTNNFTGTDSFTYKANDGQTNSGVATVTLTVSPAADNDGTVQHSAWLGGVSGIFRRFAEQ